MPDKGTELIYRRCQVDNLRPATVANLLAAPEFAANIVGCQSITMTKGLGVHRNLLRAPHFCALRLPLDHLVSAGGTRAEVAFQTPEQVCSCVHSEPSTCLLPV